MLKSRTLAAAGAALAGGCLMAAAPAFAGLPTPGTSGTHGCALADANGTAAPIVYPNSGTSQIGGNACTVTEVVGVYDNPNGSIFASAGATWSVTACTPYTVVVNGVTEEKCRPDGSWSSAAGSLPVQEYVLTPGDTITASVTNGTLVVGTLDGDPGA